MLAPDDPKWVHRDDELEPPTQAWVHRARYVGPQRPPPGARSCTATQGLERLGVQARLFGRRLLVPGRERAVEPDRDPGGDPDRAPRGDRRRADHLAAELRPLRRRGGQARDRRDAGSPTCGTRSSPTRTGAPRAGSPGSRSRASTASRRSSRATRTRSSRAADAIADEARDARAAGPVVTIANGSDFDDFAGIEHRPVGAVPDHARGQLLRQARPAAVPDRARTTPASTSSPASSATSGRPTASGRAALGLGDRLELIPYVPRRRSLELQRDSEALLLLIPEAGGRGEASSPGRCSSTSPPSGRSSPSSRPTVPPPS